MNSSHFVGKKRKAAEAAVQQASGVLEDIHIAGFKELDARLEDGKIIACVLR